LKKIFVYVLTFLLASSLLTGCGSNNSESDNTKKDNGGSTNTSGEVEYNDKTKVSNLSESMAKYQALKADVMKEMNDKATNSGSLALTLGMLPFATVDLMNIPATVCGLDEVGAQAALAFLYTNINYKKNGHDCTFTYQDNEGNEDKFISTYDPKTDSARMENYENGKLTFVTEYHKINNGYISQFYSVNDDNTYDVYKTKFVGNNISTGIFERAKNVPNSIFKNANNFSDDLKTSASMYIEINDNNSIAIVDGKTIDLSDVNTEE